MRAMVLTQPARRPSWKRCERELPVALPGELLVKVLRVRRLPDRSAHRRRRAARKRWNDARRFR